MNHHRNHHYPTILRSFISTSAIAISVCGLAHGATQTYLDSSGLNTWNTTDSNWDGGVVWNNGNDAVFAGTGELVVVSNITAHNISINSTGYTLAVGTINLDGSLPTITANADATISSQLAGTAELVKAGGAKLTLTGASPFSGDITINAGKLTSYGAKSGSNTPLGTNDNSRTINISAGATLEIAVANAFGNHHHTTVPTLIVNGGTVTNADPMLTNKVNNGLNNVVLNNGTLTSTTGNSLSEVSPNRPDDTYGAWGINGSLTSTGSSFITTTAPGNAGRVMLTSSRSDYTIFDVVDGTLTVSAVLQGGDSDAAGLYKSGAGKLVLSAVNVYRGDTTIAEGTLELNGSLIETAGSGTTPSYIGVLGGGTLSGSGTATGPLEVMTGAIIAPGSNSIATLNTGPTTITGTYQCEIGAATSDSLVITGDLDISSATIAFTSVGTPSATSYVIAEYTGSYISGTPTVTGLPAGYALQVDETNKQVKLIIATGYTAWAGDKGLDGSNNSLTDDPDFDGVNNQLEYYLDGTPTVGDTTAILPAEMLDTGYFTLTFLRRDDAEAEVSSQIVQYSTDLSDWTKSVTVGATSAPADANGVIVEITENGSAPDQIVVRIPTSQAPDGKLFGRLQVIMP